MQAASAEGDRRAEAPQGERAEAEVQEPPASVAASASTSILACTLHAAERMRERGIPPMLTKECVKHGVYVAQQAGSKKFVSDHITTIVRGGTHTRQQNVITVFRTTMLGIWRSAHTAGETHVIDAACEMFHFRDKVLFVGLGPGGKGFHFGVGEHILGATHGDCHIDAVLGSMDAGSISLDNQELVFAPILLTGTQDGESHDARDEEVISCADTRTDLMPDFDGISLAASVEGGPLQSVPVVRWLKRKQTPPAPRSWLQYHPSSELGVPQLSWRQLAMEMQSSVSLDSRVHGRWRLQPEEQDYGGVSVYTLAVVERRECGDGSVECLVVCAQSNDASQRDKWVRMGIGLAVVSPGAADGHGHKLKLRLVLGNPKKEPEFARLDTEVWNGDTTRMEKDGDQLIRLEAPTTGGVDAANQALGTERTQLDHTATTPDAVRLRVHQVWSTFLPPLKIGEAVMYGDLERVREYLARARPGMPELQETVHSSALKKLSKEFIPLLPILAAAMGKFNHVVALLLPPMLRSDLWKELLDPFVLAVLGGCEKARVELMKRVEQNPQLLGRRLSRTRKPHPLIVFKGWREMLRFEGCTLLQIASRMQHRELARQLVSAGAEHCLSSAVQAGDVEWVERHARVAELDKPLMLRGTNENVNARVDTYTPLIAAVVARDLAMVRCLVGKGASIFAKRAKAESTPINFAQVYDKDINGRLPILSALLEEYKRCRREGVLPAEWLSLPEMCGKHNETAQWWTNQSTMAREMIEQVDLEGMMDEMEGTDEMEGEEETEREEESDTLGTVGLAALDLGPST